MNHHLDRFVQRLETFTQTHRKQFSPEDRLVVLELYDELVSQLEGEAAFTLEDYDTSMKITIAAKSFLSSKDFPALQDLIHEAATFDARIQEEQIFLTFYFSFWEWVPWEHVS